ncbi:MAG: SprT-like domain-containing protein [Gemmatimonadales bacterium]
MHQALNATKFGGELSAVPIRISRRMKSRLGHYTLRGQQHCDAEIVISRRHIRRHGWDETVHTLLHEMVHQWQDEAGLRVDHGLEFRRKARAVGITPLARRDVA